MTKLVSDINVLSVLYIVIQKRHSVNGGFSINYIDRTFEMTYPKFSDRSVETCEAYRRGRACGSLPLLF